MDANLRKVLEESRRRIAAGWTQGDYAKDAQGAPCRTLSPAAMSFCLLGAFKRAQEDLGIGYYLDEELEETLGILEVGAAVWNDTLGRTQEEVVALFDKALA